MKKIKIIFLLIFIYNYFLKKKYENYTGLTTDDFYNNLKKLDYNIDFKNKNVSKCDSNNNCSSKNYDYHFNKIDKLYVVRSKPHTSVILGKNNIPVPKFYIIKLKNSNNNIINEINKNFNYPIILKPPDGTMGRGVYCNIKNDNDLLNILNNLKKTNLGDYMVENYIEGYVYRVFVFNQTVIDVIERDRPFVIGNGIDTLEKLIADKNELFKSKKLFPTVNLSQILIKEQNASMNSIIKKDKKIYISDVINMHNGSSIKRINIDNIPKKNLDMFVKVADSIGITCCGIDYISKDITKEYSDSKDVVLEVNGKPDTAIHTMVDNYGDKFFYKIVKNIFKN